MPRLLLGNNKEEYASNLEEEDLLIVGDLKRNLKWEHSVNDVMDRSYVSWQNKRKSPDRTLRRITVKSTHLTNAKLQVAAISKMVTYYMTQIRDVDFVLTTEHSIRHTKFAAADTLIKWTSENPNRLSFECDTIISNTSVADPTFPAFVHV